MKASELRQKAYDTVKPQIAEIEAEILKASDAGKGVVQLRLPSEIVRILAPYFKENGFEVWSWDESLEITWL